MLKPYSICFISLLLAVRADAETLSHAPKPSSVPGEVIIKLQPSAGPSRQSVATLSASNAGGVWANTWDRLNALCPIRSITPLIKEENLSTSRGATPGTLSLLGTAESTARSAPGLPSSGTVQIDDLRRIYLLELDLHEDRLLADVLTQLNADPEIEYAELNYVGSIDQVPDDPYFEKQWAWNNSGQSYPISGGRERTGTARADIDILSAWDTLGEPEPVVIAVLDSGVDHSHRDLQGSLWTNGAEREGQVGIDDDGNGRIDDIYGYDFVNDDGDPLDDNGHGTHCAGIIGAGIDNGLDIAGICPSVRVMAVKCVDASGSGTSFDAAEAIHYAVDNGAQVISCSWGFDDFSETLAQAIDYATGHGVVVVASAGNDDNEEIHYPAAQAPVIAVAATDANDCRASFSSYGTWVDISAPGTNVLSLRARGTDFLVEHENYTPGDNLFPCGDPNATMYIASGTSVSCPLVAGVVGLMLSHVPGRTTDYLVDRLLLSADSLDEKNPDYRGLLGTGRLNAHKALRAGFEGLIRFERDLVNGHDTLRIVLYDFDLIGLEAQEVALSSDGGDSERILLAADRAKAWMFQGTIATATDAEVPNDGVLQVSDGALIAAQYTDQDNGSGAWAEASAYAVVDDKAPVLLDVRVLTTGASPRISITADEPTTVRVLCGPVCNGPYPIQESDPSLAPEHTVTLGGVLSESDYLFVVELTDPAGNVTLCDNGGACYGFRTRPIGAIHVPGEYASIQEAIDNAWDGCTVWIADGTYTGPGNRDIDLLGKAITVRSEHGPEHCVIDCQSSSTEQHRGFVFQHGETAQSVLQGLTITNGWERLNSSDYNGGGAIACIYASPTIQNCVMVANRAVDGSGLYNLYGSPTLQNCRFEDNEALWVLSWRGDGAGMYSEGGQPHVVRCTFTGNVAADGGGIDVRNGKVTLKDCTFRRNAGDGRGGALHNSGGSLELFNCVFAENREGSNVESLIGIQGAAICHSSGEIRLFGCTFERNGRAPFSNLAGAAIQSRDQAEFVDCVLENNLGPALEAWHDIVLRNCTIDGNGGYGMLCRNSPPWRAVVNGCAVARNNGSGIVCYFSSAVTLQDCMILGNHGGDEVGGIDCSRGTLTAKGCVIAGNTGAYGALTIGLGANADLVNCTFYGNRSIDDRPGMYIEYSSARITDSILWDEGIVLLDRSDGGRSENIQITHCNVRGGWPGAGNIDVYPGFVNVAGVRPEDWDLRLLPASPCIDAGSHGVVDGVLEMATDGLPWPLDGDNDGRAVVDMGAYESAPVGGPPIIAMTPVSLDFRSALGITDAAPGAFRIVNLGYGQLDWTIDTQPPCAWLSVEPVAGSLQSDESCEITLAVGTEGLSPGEHTCDLVLAGLNTAPPAVVTAVTFDLVEPAWASHHVPSEYASIQSAIAAAEPGDRIIIAPGTYHETIQFPGHDIVLQSEDPEDPEVVAATVIDADRTGRVVTFTGSETPACKLLGLTLTGGLHRYGAGIHGGGTRATIEHCVIIDNLAQGYGEESARGGGISGCDGLIAYCTIKGNRCHEEEEEAHGGGVNGCSGTILQCRIVENVSQGEGGGLYECDGDIIECLIANNRAEEDGAGGIEQSDGRITRCRIIGNDGPQGAGGLGQCQATISDCLIAGNKGSLGALWKCHGALTHCTIVDNMGLEQGGGLRSCSGAITNCIIVGNTASISGGENMLNSATPTFSCFPGASSRGNIDVDPKFVRRGTWDTKGTPEDSSDDLWIDGDYHLDGTSACVDAGANYPVEGGSPLDLDQTPRPLDGDDSGTGVVDIGCYESNPTPPGSALIRVDTRTVEFSADVGADPPARQFLTIHNAGPGALTWRLEENCPWLSVSPAAGRSSVDPVPVTLAVHSQGLAPGRYETQLAIVADGINNSPYGVDVGLTVRGPELGFAPQDFEFLAIMGQGDPCDQTLSVYNHGVGTSPWQITSDSPWLTVDTTEGSLGASEGFRVRVGIDTAQLPFGIYTGHVILQDQTDDELHSIPVTLYLADDEIHVPADYATIQQAIDAAQNGSVIILADGCYTGPGNRGIDYHGKAITVRSTNGPEHCIIDCEQQDRGFTFNSGEPPEAVLEGVSIINGRPQEAAGGGIYCKGASPTIRNCVIQHCQSTSGAGGGIYCAGSQNQVISNCIISHNTADGIRGGGGGGGIYIASTVRWITVEHCTITHNRAVRREDATVDYYGEGGGIYYVGSYAGAAFRGPLRNCLIAHNEADLHGGGVAIHGYPPQISNCTIACNRAGAGAGGFHATEDSRLPSTKYTVVNSIVWGNEPNNLSERPDLRIGYSDIENGWSGDSNLGLDPLFVDPGGGDFHLQSQAGHWDPVEGTWITDPVTSPCIDAGDPRTDWTLEPQPNGKRINLGAYGGTEEASRSPL